MVLGKLPVPGRPTIWITVGQGPIALAVGAGGGCLDIFTLFYPYSTLSPSLWETARYRLKYCLKGPLNPKQPTNQLIRLLLRSSLIRIYTVCHSIYIFWRHYFIVKLNCFILRTTTVAGLGVPIFRVFTVHTFCIISQVINRLGLNSLGAFSPKERIVE